MSFKQQNLYKAQFRLCVHLRKVFDFNQVAFKAQVFHQSYFSVFQTLLTESRPYIHVTLSRFGVLQIQLPSKSQKDKKKGEIKCMDAFWRLLRHGHLHWQDVKTKFIGTYMEAKFAPNFFYQVERLMTCVLLCRASYTL